MRTVMSILRITNIQKQPSNKDEAPSKMIPSETIQVRNKMVRQLLYAKLKRSKSKAKLKERKARQQSDEAREEPKTIEKKRVHDETWVDENDQETLDDISNDELNSYFTATSRCTRTKIIINWSRRLSYLIYK